MAFGYNEIFKIPTRSILNKKLTKAFFLRNFEMTAAEKKLLNNSILSMDWLASIKPVIANIAAVKNDAYTYEEIQIISCTVANGQLQSLADKCAILIQKHIPYQIVLIVEDSDFFVVNVCDKRINLSDTSRRTVEKYITTTAISKLYKNDFTEHFFTSLSFPALDKTNLETTYKSYIHAVVQFQAAAITGNVSSRNRNRTEEDMQLLEEIEVLKRSVASLTSQIKKETQLNKKVSLNIQIQNTKKEIQRIQDKLA